MPSFIGNNNGANNKKKTFSSIITKRKVIKMFVITSYSSVEIIILLVARFFLVYESFCFASKFLPPSVYCMLHYFLGNEYFWFLVTVDPVNVLFAFYVPFSSVRCLPIILWTLNTYEWFFLYMHVRSCHIQYLQLLSCNFKCK